ncbi:MAG: hypothetical protein U0797_07640 [Gemmataceae bacterium]
MRTIPKYLFLLTASSLSGGCRHIHSGPNLLEDGTLCLQREHAGTATIRTISVAQEGSSLHVMGVLEGGVPAPREVNLLLKGPDGTTLASSVGTVWRGDRNRRGHRFSVFLDAVPPEGSTLRIAY